MRISEALERIGSQMEKAGLEIDLLFEKKNLVRDTVKEYYEKGLTHARIYKAIKEDVNLYGPRIGDVELRRIIAQAWQEAIKQGNAWDFVNENYQSDPDAYLGSLAKEVREWDKMPFLRTGIYKLDEAMGRGLLPGELLVLTGGEGSMKTSFALKMIDTYLKEVGGRVLFFSLDMEPERVVLRRLCPLMGMNYKSVLREMKENTREYQEAVRKRDSLDKGNFRIYGGPLTLKQMLDRMELENPAVVFIDYLTCIEGFNSELECARESIKAIRKWKREYQYTFITLNQLSEQSKANQRQGVINPPAMGGGSSQQAADVKIDLFKDAVDASIGNNDIYTITRPRIIATISKTRDAVAGRSFELEYNGMTMEFSGEAKEVFRQKQRKAVFGDHTPSF